MRHRREEGKPGFLAWLGRLLRKRPEEALDQTGSATAYPHRAGAFFSPESAQDARQLQDAMPTQLLDSRLLTRAGEYRASFSQRNRREYR